MNAHYLTWIIWTILFILTCGLHTMQHEQVHEAIAFNHGCINGSIHYGITSTFTCNEYSGQSADVAKQEAYLQSQNELIGYNMVTVFYLVYAVVSVFLFRSHLL